MQSANSLTSCFKVSIKSLRAVAAPFGRTTAAPQTTAC
jgi:hypothetical protein